MNPANINRLNNEYRVLINRAMAINSEQNGVRCNEEGLCYQRAAAICGQLATMSIGAEAEHWIREQQKCQQQMRTIWHAMHPKTEAGSVADDKSSDTPVEAGSKKEASGQSGAAKKDADGIKQEVVDSWFKPDPGYGFDEVVGMQSVKDTLSKCVRDKKLSGLTEYLGLPTVQSFFFYGPPGCGKTYIIKAFVHELMKQGYSYMSVQSADIHSKFSGEADKILRRIFREAVNRQPCVLFMDEIDGVCQNRDMPNLSDFNMQLTTTFLTSYNELNEANRENKSIIFIAATNYPANVDTAMLDRMELIPIPLPDDETRESSFKKQLENLVKLDCDVTWAEIVDATSGYSQRDISRVSQKLLMAVYQEASALVNEEQMSVEEVVNRLKDGVICLSREMVYGILDNYKLKPNADIERSLNEFESKT